MNLLNYSRKILIGIFFIILLQGCSSKEPTKYSDLHFFDLVMNKEDSIHQRRISNLNIQITSTEKKIIAYKKNIIDTKQAINNLKIEIRHYNSIINNITNKIDNINQLNSVLNQFEQQIRNVEIEFDRVKRVSDGLERIDKSEFLNLKRKGYFKKFSDWSEYTGCVANAIETKKEIDRYIKSSKKGIAYVKANKKRILKKIAKKGVVKVIGHFIPILTPLFILDDLKDIYDYATA